MYDHLSSLDMYVVWWAVFITVGISSQNTLYFTLVYLYYVFVFYLRKTGTVHIKNYISM